MKCSIPITITQLLKVDSFFIANMFDSLYVAQLPPHTHPPPATGRNHSPPFLKSVS